jgi:hypothetical protein
VFEMRCQKMQSMPEMAIWRGTVDVRCLCLKDEMSAPSPDSRILLPSVIEIARSNSAKGLNRRRMERFSKCVKG